MTNDPQDELIAIVAAARSIQAAAEKAVADLNQSIADNRAVPAEIIKEGGKARQDIQKTGDQILTRISQGAEKAIRDAAVSDVGAKIETAMVGPMRTIEQALEKLKESANAANQAAQKWRLFTRVFSWQQITIAVLAGILLGAVGHWYFVTRGPETEAVEYILTLKQERDQRQASPAPVSAARTQRPGPSHKLKPENIPEEQTIPAEPQSVPDSQSAQPPQ